MRRIILARHGLPVWDYWTPIPGHGLGPWLAGERDAPIDTTRRPSPELERLAREAGRLIASPLRRSVESARLLYPTGEATIIADVQEVALPSDFGTGLRLPPNLWAGVARAAWWCGWSAGVESFAAARRRAARAADTLHELAERYGSIIVIGHGFMNALLATQLRRLGWAGPGFPSRRHWAFSVYSD